MVSPIHEDPDPNVQHPLVVIDRGTKKVTYTAAYYYLAHFGRFVRPDAVRVKTGGSMQGVRCLAFKSPQGGLVVEIMNSRHADASVPLDYGGRIVNVNLPALSISTLLWNPA
jgi:glucosylceramidase